MKKLVVLLMLVGTCFSFVACGGDSQTGGENNNNNAESFGNNESKDHIEDTENNNESKEDIQVSDQRVFGEWLSGDKVIVINNDGTCTMNGETYTWKISRDSGILSTGEVDIEIVLSKNGEHYEFLTYSVTNNRNVNPLLYVGIDFGKSYINNSLYDDVTLTVDNFWNYFELNEIEYNGFIYRGIQVKEDYRNSVVMGLSGADMEMKIPQTNMKIDFDETTRTYTIISSSDETMENREVILSINPHKTFDYYEINEQDFWVLSNVYLDPSGDIGGNFVSLDSSKYEIVKVEGYLRIEKK